MKSHYSLLNACVFIRRNYRTKKRAEKTPLDFILKWGLCTKWWTKRLYYKIYASQPTQMKRNETDRNTLTTSQILHSVYRLLVSTQPTNTSYRYKIPLRSILSTATQHNTLPNMSIGCFQIPIVYKVYELTYTVVSFSLPFVFKKNLAAHRYGNLDRNDSATFCHFHGNIYLKMFHDFALNKAYSSILWNNTLLETVYMNILVQKCLFVVLESSTFVTQV